MDVGTSVQVPARADEEVHTGHLHLHHQEHNVHQHRYPNQEQQRMAAAAAAFQISAPAEPIITTMISSSPMVHHGSVILQHQKPYDHSASYRHHQQVVLRNWWYTLRGQCYKFYMWSIFYNFFVTVWFDFFWRSLVWFLIIWIRRMSSHTNLEILTVDQLLGSKRWSWDALPGGPEEG